MGIVATVPFVLVIRIYIKPFIPYLLQQPPWSWMGYIDTICCDNLEQAYTNCVEECVQRCEKTIAARARGRSSFSWLWEPF